MAISWHHPFRGHSWALRIDEQKLANKTTVQSSTAQPQVDPIVLDSSSSILLVPFFWMIKFSGVLLERKGELMIVNRNGDENGASTVKGGGFVWKVWARQQFQCRGVIDLDFLIDQEGSMLWHRRKKKLL
jgi:hypothetical protein